MPGDHAERQVVALGAALGVHARPGRGRRRRCAATAREVRLHGARRSAASRPAGGSGIGVGVQPLRPRGPGRSRASGGLVVGEDPAVAPAHHDLGVGRVGETAVDRPLARRRATLCRCDSGVVDDRCATRPGVACLHRRPGSWSPSRPRRCSLVAPAGRRSGSGEVDAGRLGGRRACTVAQRRDYPNGRRASRRTGRPTDRAVRPGPAAQGPATSRHWARTAPRCRHL